MAIHAVLVAGKEGDDEDPELIGKWLRVDQSAISREDKFICSVCGAEPWWCGVTEDVLPKYCPNCGADMMANSMPKYIYRHPIVECKNCKLIKNCPIQKKKDKNQGNLWKEILGCNEGEART